jgi:hypothetical protein
VFRLASRYAGSILKGEKANREIRAGYPIGCEFLVLNNGKFCLVLLNTQCEEVPMK